MTRGLLLGLFLAVAPMVGGQPNAAEVRIVVQDGQSLRDIAQEQLGDPDLWTEVLKANGLTSPADVRAGMELLIPGR